MGMVGVGFFTSLIVGAIAGWIAEKIMRSDMGLFRNILLGIVGAMFANFVLEFFTNPWEYAGFWGQLVVAVIGACALIAIWRMIKGRPVRS